jgi:Beta-lactamase
MSRWEGELVARHTKRRCRRNQNRRPAVRALATASLCFCIVTGSSTKAVAQDRSPSDQITLLNRNGRWHDAVALAAAYLDSALTAPKGERCRVREGLVYAWTRLRADDAARTSLAALDAECPSTSLGADLRAEIKQLRRELSSNPREASPRDDVPSVQETFIKPDLFWRVVPPEGLGLNVRALDAHLVLCKRTGADACLIAYRGAIVQEWYSARYVEPAFAMSSTKSVTGLLVGMLLADHKIRSVDQRVCDFIKVWCTGLRGKVTLRHLLTMTSGLPRMRDSSVGFVDDKNRFVLHLTPVSEPGTIWAYSNEGAQLLSPILDKAAGELIQNYAQRRLFQPLGMSRSRLHLDSKGHAWTYADMETTARDFARVGLLMLQRGRWEGRQIVGSRWIDSSTSPSQKLNPQYGLLWWLDPSARAYAAHGHLDTDLHVLPQSELVIVRMQTRPFPGVKEGEYEREALLLFPQIVANPRNGRGSGRADPRPFAVQAVRKNRGAAQNK